MRMQALVVVVVADTAVVEGDCSTQSEIPDEEEPAMEKIRSCCSSSPCYTVFSHLMPEHRMESFGSDAVMVAEKSSWKDRI